MNWKVAWIPAVPVALLVAVLASGFGIDPHALPSMLEGQQAPSFELVDLDGKTISSESLLGKPAVLNFWSTWCEPCKVEHDILQQGARYYGSDVQFLGVVYQDTAEAARGYLNNRSNVFPQVLDSDSKTAINYGVSGVPESFFIDATGRIHYKHAGVVTPPLMREKIAELVQAGSRSAR